MTQPLVELDQVTFEYRRSQPVLRRLSLDVQAGASVALLGPSGSGKTTLLHLVAGFLEPTSGSIRLAGEVVSGPGRHVPPRRRGIGMVFQGLALWPHLRVEEHLDFVLGGTPLTREERSRRKGWVLDMLELGSLSRRLPGELSGGEMQRLALGRAIAPRPRLLLLDEPLVALDERLRRKMLDLIARVYTEAGTTLILVTHDARDALALASQVAVIVKGEIRQAGPCEEIYRRPASREVAELCGAVSFVSGEVVERGRVRTALGILSSASPAEAGSRVIVPLRPEDVAVSLDGSATGLVRRSHFAGGAWEVDVELDGVAVKGRSAAAAPPGSKVRIAVREPVWAFESGS